MSYNLTPTLTPTLILTLIPTLILTLIPTLIPTLTPTLTGPLVYSGVKIKMKLVSHYLVYNHIFHSERHDRMMIVL